MTKTQSRRAAPQKAQPLLAGRTLRLLLCAFLFTAAAVCKTFCRRDTVRRW